MKDKTYAILIFILWFLIIPLSFMIACDPKAVEPVHQPSTVEQEVHMIINESDLKDTKAVELVNKITEARDNYCIITDTPADSIWVSYTITVEVQIHH